MEKEEYFWIFFVFWAILGLGSFLFFQFYKNTKIKKKVLPVFVIFAGLIFMSFVVFMAGFSYEVLWIMVPAIALISFLNIRNTKFCDNCGKMIYNNNWFSKQEFCSKCGMKL